MLQVARLAPKQLSEARDLVTGFLSGQWSPDGGVLNRAGQSDLYYTVFGLEGLIALQADIPSTATMAYLKDFADGASLDFVHLACLARCWASVSADLRDVPTGKILERLEGFRSADGGYSQTAGAATGSVYASFLALGAYQDLRSQLPNPQRMLGCLEKMRASDGSYANHSGAPAGLTTVTAAAVTLRRQLSQPPEPAAADWLMARLHSQGGFVATPSTPFPDLLSTATALHALAGLHVPIQPIREACLDFVDTLWTSRGGFFGHWSDDVLDCEYTYYGLLALGHLSL